MSPSKIDPSASDPMPKPPLTWKRRLLRAVVIVVTTYVLVCAAMYVFQDALLFPGRSSQGTALSQRVDTKDTEVVHFAMADGTPLGGHFASVGKDAEHVPTVLYFYGNASCAAWSIAETELLRGLGCNVFVPDFAGYGISGGHASEANFYATATAAWDYLQQRPGIDHSKVIVMGWSIGSAVAIDLASRKDFAGLITFSAFTSLGDVAQSQYFWAPARWLLHSRFDNLSKLDGIRAPVLSVHGQQDALVNPAMQQVLVDRLGSKATRLVLPNADHNTIFDVDTPMLREAMAKFIAAVNGRH